MGEGGVFGTICAGNVSFLVGYSHLLDIEASITQDIFYLKVNRHG